VHVSATLGQQQQAEFNPTGGTGAANSGPPPNLGDPVSGPAQLLSSLWSSYGPTIIASGAALIRQSQAAAASQATARSVPSSNQGFSSPPVPPAPARRDTTQSVFERRRQLEAELASLPPLTPPPAEIRIPDYQPTRSSSVSDSIRERNVATMKFEEVDVPSDTEGYDVGGSGTDEGNLPGNQPARSWFGWVGGGNADTKYERVKSD
jgi:receptor expression-enhancing protein 1/2/3/4